MDIKCIPWSREQEHVLVSSTSKDFQTLYEGKSDAYVLWPLDFDLWPLNSRLVYCSRLYGIYTGKRLQLQKNFCPTVNEGKRTTIMHCIRSWDFYTDPSSYLQYIVELLCIFLVCPKKSAWLVTGFEKRSSFLKTSNQSSTFFWTNKKNTK